MKGISGRKWVLLSQGVYGKEGIKEVLLRNRGVGYEFLESKLKNLTPPFDIPNIQPAVELITDCIRREKRIVIYGDYDVDGITGTAILFDLLKRAGAKVLPLLPSRKRGYGLTKELVKKLNQYADLLITVDNGTTAIEELSLATIPTIILDHHNPGENLPKSIVVNPKLSERERWDLKELSSSGLAFYLSALLRRALELDIDVRHYLHFACLGTVADVMPMNSTNRIIVSKGIELLNYVLKGVVSAPGLRVLMERSGIRDEITSREIAFSLAPRLNAPGRVAKPYVALKLLLERDENRARLLVEKVDRLNEKRKYLSQTAFDEAIRQAKRQEDKKLLVVKLEESVGGVAGIVAGRLASYFSKPAIVMAVGKEYTTASARSTINIDIYSVLKEVSHLFVKWGGHPSAAGFTIRSDRIGEFEALAEDIFKDIPTLDSPLQVDMVLPLREIDQHIYEVLRDLEPFGEGFPEPLFMSEPLSLTLLEGNRERLRLRANDYYLLSWDPTINDKLLKRNVNNKRIVYKIDRKKPKLVFLVDVEE